MMKKHSNQITKFLFLLLSIILIGAIMSIGVFAANSTKEVIVDSGITGYVDWKLDDAGTLTIYGTGAMYNYTSKFDVPWYSHRSAIRKVVIEDSVTRIGGHAFADCDKLTSIVVPDSVEIIDRFAFEGCNSLKEITLPFIGSKADAKQCFGYIFGASVSSSNDSYVPSSLKTVNIYKACNEISYGAFYNCKNLISINIPDSVTSIGNSAFENCSSLTSINIPDGVTSIGDYTFYNCSSLTSINIPDGITSIGSYAFYNCDGLTSINIPNSVTSIGACAFYDCSRLTSINLPDSVTSIGSSSFYNCIRIKTVFYAGTQTEKSAIFVNTNPLNNATWHYEVEEMEFAGQDCIYCAECDTCFLPDGSYAYATITFKNDDGSIIETKQYRYNENIDVQPPVKESGNSHIFVFNGWDKEIVACVGNTTYTANYALIHDYSEEWTIDKKATCTTEGIKSHHCTACNGQSNITIISALGHDFEEKWTIDKTATCTTAGSMSHHCTRCNAKSDVTSIPASDHSYKTTTTKATTSANGKRVTKCTECGDIKSTKTIHKISSVKLSATEYTYNGSAKKPTVTIKDVKGNKLESGVDYTVSYASGRKLPGKYKVTITFRGYYSGTKSLYFTINPKAPSNLTVSSRSTSSIKLSWPKVTGATGYRIYRYDSSTKTYKTVATTTNLSYTVKNLKSATNYTYRIKSYKKLSDGTTLWSGYRALTTATKPVAPLISSVKSSAKGKVTLKWNDVARESGYQIYYSTSKTGTYKLYDMTSSNDVFETYTGFKSGRTYYFKVRAFKTVNGNRIYSSFSPAKGIKIK